MWEPSTLVGRIYDVKIWYQTSNFHVGRPIGSILDNSKAIFEQFWLSFLAGMVISHIAIDHMIARGLFITLKLV